MKKTGGRGEEIAVFSEGVKSPCPRGGTENPCFFPGGEKMQIFVQEGSQEKVSEG